MQTARSNNAAPLALVFAGKLLAHQRATDAQAEDAPPGVSDRAARADARSGRWPNGEVIMLPPGCAG